MKNPKNMFYYQKYSLLDINLQVQNDSRFTIRLQYEWQLEMMVKSGHKENALSIDATFVTSQTRVSYTSVSFINISYHSMCFIVPF